MAFQALEGGAFDQLCKRWSFSALDYQNIEYQLLHHRDDRQREIIGINVALLLLASISVVLRLLGRRFHKAPLKADDYVMIAAMVSAQTVHNWCYILITCLQFPACGLCAAEILSQYPT